MSRFPWSKTVAVALASVLAQIACGEPDGTGGARLALELEKEITPAGVACAVRPDSARLGQTTYLGFTSCDQPQTFGLLELDASLTPVGRRVLAGTAAAGADVVVDKGTTDLRITAEGQQGLWCAYETMLSSGGGTCRNCLNVSAYRRSSGSTLALAAYGEVSCVEWSCSAQPGVPSRMPAGYTLPDDPVPFYEDGQYYVLLRKQELAVLPVRVFDASFTEKPAFELDLRAAISGSAFLSVYSILRVNGRLSIVAALQDGPPSEPGKTSYLALIPIADDLRSVAGPLVTLSRTEAYQAYVSGARFLDGKLYLTHNIHSRQMGGPNKGQLKVFDVTRGYTPLEDILINEGTPSGGYFVDDHLTLELIDGKVHVFFPRPDNKLMVKVFAWSKG